MGFGKGSGAILPETAIVDPCRSLSILMGLKLFFAIVQIFLAIQKIIYMLRPIEALSLREPYRVLLFDIVNPIGP